MSRTTVRKIWVFGIVSLIGIVVYIHESSPKQATILVSGDKGRGDPSVGTKAILVAPAADVSQRPTNPAQESEGENWTREFYQSKDYFSFVSKAAVEAINGDGRAAYFVSRAVATCMPLRVQYGDSPDPDAANESDWREHSAAPKWLLDKARVTFQQCRGMIKGDPFAELPHRTEGYWSQSFWQDQAYVARDPLATAWHAGTTLSNAMVSNPSGARTIASAQDDINNAVASKDPAAIFQVGQILSDEHFSSSSTKGFAIAVAACQLGYDCSASNSALEPYLGCAPLGTCPPGMNYSDVIKNAVGEAGYAAVYAQAQVLLDALSRGDTSAIQEFVRLRPVS